MSKIALPQLIDLPIRTFADIAPLGFVLRVWCSGCRSTREVDVAAIAARRMAGARFRCRGCGGFGYPSIEPPELLPAGAAIERVDLYCHRCRPAWQLRDARLDLEPWSRLRASPGLRFRCPGCRRAVEGQWQGRTGVPFTAGWRR